MNFDDLKLACGFKCKECKLYTNIWLQGEYLHKYGEIPKDQQFQDQVLNDLEQHIRAAHPERTILIRKATEK